MNTSLDEVIAHNNTQLVSIHIILSFSITKHVFVDEQIIMGNLLIEFHCNRSLIIKSSNCFTSNHGYTLAIISLLSNFF